MVPPGTAALLYVSCDGFILTSLRPIINVSRHDRSSEQRALGFTDLLARLAPEYRTWLLNDVGLRVCDYEFS